MKNKNKIEYLNTLRKINNESRVSQRKLAQSLGFSLGKLNYLLKALKEKGLIKIKNFQNQNNKIKYFSYVITPKGIKERTKLTINFMKRKMIEYEELKKELKKK